MLWSIFAAASFVAAYDPSRGSSKIAHLYDETNPYHRMPPVGSDPDFDCAWRKAAFLYV